MNGDALVKRPPGRLTVNRTKWERENRLRILDTTLFYTQASGGVRTYIDGKRQALLRRGDISHKVVMPGSGVFFDGDFVSLPAMPLPMAPGFRFPLRLGLWSSIIAGLQPDVIEAGDPYTPAWAAQRAAQRAGRGELCRQHHTSDEGTDERAHSGGSASCHHGHAVLRGPRRADPHGSCRVRTPPYSPVR